MAATTCELSVSDNDSHSTSSWMMVDDESDANSSWAMVSELEENDSESVDMMMIADKITVEAMSIVDDAMSVISKRENFGPETKVEGPSYSKQFEDCDALSCYDFAKVRGNRKHDLSSKYHGLNGATAGKIFRARGFTSYRRKMHSSPFRHNYCSGLDEDECNIFRGDPTAVTAIDLEFLGMDLLEFIGGAYLISNKVQGKSAFKMGRHNLWKIEQELEKRALVKRVGSGADTGPVDKLFEEIQYDVPIEGTLVHKETSAQEVDFNLSIDFPSGASFERNPQNLTASQHEIYEVLKVDVESHTVKARLIGKYPKEIPVEITERGLVEFRDCMLRTAYGAGGVRTARCRDMSSGAFFRLPTRGGKYGTKPERNFLEVDLGQKKWVHAVSTQARIPQTVVFPSMAWLRDNMGRRETWRGPRFTTFDARRDKSATHNRFYKMFRLEYRSGSGAPWVSVGVFGGPVDNFEEKVQFLEDPIFCRYLRFFPLDGESETRWKRVAEKYKGMKVAVFGEAPEETHQVKNDTEAVNDTTICSYTIYKRKENSNRHLQPRKMVRSHVNSRCRCSYCFGDKLPRAIKKSEWKREIKEVTQSRVAVADARGIANTMKNYRFLRFPNGNGRPCL